MNEVRQKIWHTCRKRYFTALTVFTVGVCVVAAIVLTAAKCLIVSDFIVTAAYFYIFGMIGYAVLEWSDRRGLPHTTIFIAIKFCKLLLSVLFIVIRALVSKDDISAFALTFIGFYIVYLLFETFCLVRLEKTLSKDTK